MRNLFRKIIKKDNTKATNNSPRDVSDTTNAVFEKYRKSFKDLARYDREGKIGAN